MKKEVLTILTIICLCLGGSALAGNGKGKGPGNNNSETRAQFVVPAAGPGTPAVLLGDSQGIYQDSDDPSQAGVTAYFMGSGNPKLELAEGSERYLLIKPQGTCSSLDGLADLEGDVVVQGDALWFANLSSVIESSGGLAGDLCSSGQCFLDMVWGTSGYSMMPLRFTATVDSTDYLYRVLLGKADTADPLDEREPVVVTRGTGSEIDSWNISGMNNGISRGSVKRKIVKKGKSSWEDLGYCDFYLGYDIHLLP